MLVIEQKGLQPSLWLPGGNSVRASQDFVALRLYQRQSPPHACAQGLKNRLFLYFVPPSVPVTMGLAPLS